MVYVISLLSQLFWRQFFILQKCSLYYNSKSCSRFSRSFSNCQEGAIASFTVPHGWCFCVWFWVWESDERWEVFLKFSNCGENSRSWKGSSERTIKHYLIWMTRISKWINIGISHPKKNVRWGSWYEIMQLEHKVRTSEVLMYIIPHICFRHIGFSRYCTRNVEH